jgi:hypothetical protein
LGVIAAASTGKGAAAAVGTGVGVGSAESADAGPTPSSETPTTVEATAANATAWWRSVMDPVILSSALAGTADGYQTSETLKRSSHRWPGLLRDGGVP